MKRMMLIFQSALILFAFNGCGEPEVKIVYIDRPCPKLKTWVVKPITTPITYEVVHDG